MFYARYRKRPIFYTSSQKLEFSRKLRNEPTKAEELLWARIRLGQLDGYRFIRQRVILGWIVDFYCPQKRLAIEVDGPYHLYDRGARERDSRKDMILSKNKIRVLRFSNSAIELRIEETLQIIREVLAK